MIEKYSKLNCCPVCGRELVKKQYEHIFEYGCRNSCFRIERDLDEYIISVFERVYLFWSDNKSVWLNNEEEIDSRIEYWKENDKYLIKLLNR